MRKNSIAILVVLLTFLVSVNVYSQKSKQNTPAQMLKQLTISVKDSLAGFDEMFYKAQALDEGFFGDEFHVFMYQRKREYIDNKYQLFDNLNNNQNQIQGGKLGGGGIGGGGDVINAAPCVNEDFELNNFSGWTISSGQNNNSCAYNLCPTPGSPEAWIRTTPWPDANFPGGIPNSPLGGTRVAQLNNNNAAAGRITRIRQTFPVTPSNALFQFAYAAAFNPAHPCCSQPYLNIYVKNCAGQILACPQISVVAPGPGCVSPAPGFTTVGNVARCLWQVKSLDLTAQIGSCVTIEVTVGDCSGWAHWGYVYFDALCGPMNLIVNGNVFPAGTQATTVSACGANTATITAPPGLQPYVWNGPPGSGVVNNPNQTFTTSTTGQYTLTMNPPGACAPIIKLVTVQFAPTPTAGIISSNACNIFTFTNTGSPAPAVQTFSFFGPSPIPSFTTQATSTTVVFPVQGQYTVMQVVTNTAGCTASVQAVINVPLAPNVGFAINSATQCLAGNSFSFTAADPTGTHGYSFSPGIGAPPPGNTPNYGPVVFTQAGTYTVTHSVNAGGCTSFSNAIIVVNPPPVITATNSGAACLNSSLTLSATGGTSYSWTGPLGFMSALQNPTLTNASLGMTGQYTVLVTGATGCTNTAVTDVTVYALPAPTITSNNPVCAGSVLSLTASGGIGYNWIGPNSFTSTLTTPLINNVSLLANGIYTLIAGTGNCTVSTTASITINPLPNITAGNNSPACLNQPFSLNANGGNSYSWSGPNGYTDITQNPTIAVASMTNAGVYTVTGTDMNSCVNTATTTVTVNPLPIITANNPTACANGIIALSAGGGNTYAWSGPLGYSSALANPVLSNVQVNMSGQYLVIGTSVLGCTNAAVANVSVSANPTANITSNSPVCFGNSLTIDATGGNTYNWSGPNSFTSTSSNNLINNVTMAANGNYSLIVTVNTCTSLATVSVIVNNLPTPNIITNNPICQGSSINFTATGGATYLWSGPNNFSGNGQAQVIPNADSTYSGIYSVTATDVNGCVNSTTTSILVKPLPLISTQGSTVCLGHTASLSVTGNGTYIWSGPNGFTSSQANITFPNFSESQAGAYYVVLTGINQCTVLAASNVTNWPQPIPLASNSGPVCLNGEVNFYGSGGHIFQWRGPNGFIANTATTTLLSANSLQCSGVYTLGVTDAKGCQAFTTTNLLVRALPQATLISSEKSSCVPFCTNFSANSSSSLQTIYWSLNDGGMMSGNTINHCFNSVGSYVMKSSFSDVYGCANTSSMIVEAYPIPVADFHYAPGEPVEKDQIEFIDASSGKSLSAWTWFFGANNHISFKQNPNYIFEEPGTYPVAMIVSNVWGCKDTIVRAIPVAEGFNLYIPNAFSPNADGLNDVFQPKGYGIKSYYLSIFDRWGEKLFETNDFATGWDGRYKGELCKDDVYVWQISAYNKDGKQKEFKGTVTLYR